MDAIEYYNKYASKIFEDTVNQDMEDVRQEFLSYLEDGGTILDLGCGSGRDSLAFYQDGYDVTPLDAAEDMCKLAEIHTGLEVLHMTYEDMDFDDVFDGIWGCKALIHIPEEELADIMEKIIGALHQNGILFLSFREGEFEGFQGERYFCDYTEEKLRCALQNTGRLEIHKLWVSEGIDGTAAARWLNVLAKKIS